MSDKKATNVYDDGNIPGIDLPKDSSAKDSSAKGKNSTYSVEPLPESSRPRKDGPGGD